MQVLLNSDIAKLVLGYLKDENLPSVYKKFCRSSKYLCEEYELYKKGYEPVSLATKNLVEIIKEYCELKSTINQFFDVLPDNDIEKCLNPKSLKKKLEFLIHYAKQDTYKNSTFLQPATPARKRKRSLSISSNTSNDTSICETPQIKKKKNFNLSYTLLDVDSKENSLTETEYDEGNRNCSRNRNSEKIDKKKTINDVSILKETILDNTEFQNKLVANINKVLNSANHNKNETSNKKDIKEHEDILQQQLDDAIKNILNATEQDPIFEQIVDDVVYTRSHISSDIDSVVHERTLIEENSPLKIENNENDNHETETSTPNISNEAANLKSNNISHQNQIDTAIETIIIDDNSISPDEAVENSNPIEILSNELIPSGHFNRNPILVPRTQYANTSNMIFLNSMSPMCTLPIVNIGTQQMNIPFFMTPTINLQERNINIPVIIQTNTINSPNEKKKRKRKIATPKNIVKTLSTPDIENVNENAVSDVYLDKINSDIVVQERPTGVSEPSLTFNNSTNEETDCRFVVKIDDNTTITEPSFLPPPSPSTDLPISEKITTPQENLRIHNYLKIKSNSTPRRRSHIRVLDFTTPGKEGNMILSKTPQTIERSINIKSANSSRFQNRFRKKCEKTIEEPSESWDRIHGFKTVVGSAKKDSNITVTPKVKKDASCCARVLSRSASEENALDGATSINDLKENQLEPSGSLTPMDQWKKLRSIESKDWDQYLRYISADGKSTARITNRRRRKKINKRISKTSPASNLRLSSKLSKRICNTKARVTVKTKAQNKKKKIISPAKKKNLVGKLIEKKIKEDVSNCATEIKDVDVLPAKCPDEKIIEKQSTMSLIKDDDKIHNKENEVSEEASVVKGDQIEIISVEIISNENKKADIAENTVTDTDANIKLSTELKVENPILKLPDFTTMASLLETPFKTDILSHPITPRFVSQSGLPVEDTPITKILKSLNKHMSTQIELPEILTPSFPITPGYNITPPKHVDGTTPGSNKLYNLPTDYSSSSSYYRPDESDNDKFEALINAERQGKVDEELKDISTVTANTNIVECPGVIERVKSFSQTTDKNIIPHYTFTEEIVEGNKAVENLDHLSSSNNSSSSSASNSSSESSSSSSSNDSDSDKDYEPEDSERKIEIIDEKGEIRYPIRTWITPKKIENEIVNTLPKDEQSKQSDQIKELEEKRLRIKEKLKTSETNIKSLKPHKKNYMPKRTNIQKVARHIKLADKPKTNTKPPRKNPTPRKLVSHTNASIALTTTSKSAFPVKCEKSKNTAVSISNDAAELISVLEGKKYKKTPIDENSTSIVNSDSLLKSDISKSNINKKNDCFVKLQDFVTETRSRRKISNSTSSSTSKHETNEITQQVEQIEKELKEINAEKHSTEKSQIIVSEECQIKQEFQNIYDMSKLDIDEEADQLEDYDDFDDCEIKTFDDCVEIKYDPDNSRKTIKRENIDLSTHLMRVHCNDTSFTLKINEVIDIFEKNPKNLEKKTNSQKSTALKKTNSSLHSSSSSRNRISPRFKNVANVRYSPKKTLSQQKSEKKSSSSTLSSRSERSRKQEKILYNEKKKIKSSFKNYDKPTIKNEEKTNEKLEILKVSQKNTLDKPVINIKHKIKHSTDGTGHTKDNQIKPTQVNVLIKDDLQNKNKEKSTNENKKSQKINAVLAHLHGTVS